MISAISKKYTKALAGSQNDTELSKSLESLNRIGQALRLSKFHDILGAKNISYNEKISLISEIAQNGDEKFSNFLKILIKAQKVELVPAIAEEIRVLLAQKSGKVSGIATACFDVDASDLSEISQMLSKKLNREVELVFVKTDTNGFNGIKVEISDLGIEIEINKNALKKSIIAHVLNTSKIF